MAGTVNPPALPLPHRDVELVDGGGADPLGRRQRPDHPPRCALDLGRRAEGGRMRQTVDQLRRGSADDGERVAVDAGSRSHRSNEFFNG